MIKGTQPAGNSNIKIQNNPLTFGGNGNGEIRNIFNKGNNCPLKAEKCSYSDGGCAPCTTTAIRRENKVVIR
ncbi:Uncharacterised protein [uncultured archaeon]|nr:Uncharacterised protein [uncultured archaeon]